MWQLTVGIICGFLFAFGNGQGMEWNQCGRWSECKSQFGCCRCWNDKCLDDSHCGWFHICHEYRCAFHKKGGEDRKKRSICANDDCTPNPLHLRPKRWSGSSCTCSCIPEPPLAQKCSPILPPCSGDVDCHGNHACIAGGCAPLNPHFYG